MMKILLNSKVSIMRSHVAYYVVCQSGCHAVRLLDHAAVGESIDICQVCRVGPCSIASPEVRERGMRVGKGKSYNYARPRNAVPNQFGLYMYYWNLNRTEIRIFKL